MSAPDLSAEDAAARDRLRARVEALVPGARASAVHVAPVGGGWRCSAYAETGRDDYVDASATAPTAGEALCECARRLRVAL